MRSGTSLALLIGALLLLPLAASPARAQEGLALQVNSVDTSGYPTVQATVTVFDETFRPIPGLPPEAFTVEADGQSLPVSSVADASDTGLGISVVLAFDTSGSMEGQPLAAAKDAGKTLVAELGPQDEVAVLAFSNQVVQLVGFTQDRAAATAAIDSLVAEGNTALHQGVSDSAGLAATSTLPRRAVVLLSDGVDFGGVSQVDAQTSLEAAEASGAPFFVVGLGTEIDQAYLDQLATISGGQLLLAPTPDALGGLYEGIGGVLRQQYVLTFDAGSLPPGFSGPLTFSVSFGGAIATAQTEVTVPGGATVAPTEPPTPAATAAGGEEGGGSSVVVLAGAGVAVGILAVAGVAGVYLWRRRRKDAAEEPQIDFRRAQEQPTAHLFHVAAPAPAEESTAYLLAQGGSGERYPLGDAPTTVGFTSDCDVRLAEGGGAAGERVRIWRREGRFMLHNLSRIGVVHVSGRPVVWAILEDGDEVQIGGVRLGFHDNQEIRREPESTES